MISFLRLFTSLRMLIVFVLVLSCSPFGGDSEIPNDFHPGVAAAPEITSVSPSTGSVNGETQITLTGTDFLDGATVTVGGLDCTSPSVLSSTSLTCITPQHIAGLYDVVVTNPDSQTGTLADGFTFE